MGEPRGASPPAAGQREVRAAGRDLRPSPARARGIGGQEDRRSVDRVHLADLGAPGRLPAAEHPGRGHPAAFGRRQPRRRRHRRSGRPAGRGVPPPPGLRAAGPADRHRRDRGLPRPAPAGADRPHQRRRPGPHRPPLHQPPLAVQVPARRPLADGDRLALRAPGPGAGDLPDLVGGGIAPPLRTSPPASTPCGAGGSVRAAAGPCSSVSPPGRRWRASTSASTRCSSSCPGPPPPGRASTCRSSTSTAARSRTASPWRRG